MRLKAAITVGSMILLLAPALARANPFVLYDVNFDTAPVGQLAPVVPVEDAPAYPRTAATYSRGLATVMPSVGDLLDKPVLFSSAGSSLGFSTGLARYLDNDCIAGGGSLQDCYDFHPWIDRYLIELDVLPLALVDSAESTYGFRIFLEDPSVTTIDFTEEGTISLFQTPWPGTASYEPIGSFSFGEVTHIAIVVDFDAEELSIRKDGMLLATAPWTERDLSGFNLSLASRYPLSEQSVAVDNIRITAVPEPAAGLLVLVGVGCMARARRGRVRCRLRTA